MKLTVVAVRAFVVASGFLWLWAWVAGALRRFDDLTVARPFPPAPVGIAVLSAGFALAIWCIATFVVRGHGTPAPFDPPRKLVAAGPYRYIRNPMYIGGGLVLLGFGLVQRSPAVVLFVPVWWLLFQLLVLLYEEPVLRHKFGREYDEYCRRTPRWIPRLRRPASAVAAALFLICAAFRFAQNTPNFTGEWKLNIGKSDFGVLRAPEHRVDHMRHEEPVLRVASRQSRGDRQSASEIECRTDGSDCTVSIRGSDLKLAATARWRGRALVVDSRGEYNAAQFRMSDRWTLSPDGKTLTIARSISSDSGETHQNLVLEKQ
jgi:protein-S-isoprenylcysteine O-methyltransferase Ste14